MALSDGKRACRHPVKWPARVKAASDAGWRDGQVVNLSVTGVLLQVDHQFPVGECVEVEIDFLTQPECKTVVSGVGYIVREDDARPGIAAVRFEIECGLAPRREDADSTPAAEPPTPAASTRQSREASRLERPDAKRDIARQ